MIRRVLLLLLGVSLAGLFVARASNFATNAEDIAAFNPPVSISVPETTTTSSGCTPNTLASTYWLRTVDIGPSDEDRLDAVAPATPPFDNVQTRGVDWTSDAPVQLQATGGAYITWRAPVATGCGYLVGGNASVFIQTVRTGISLGAFNVEVGLFVCSSSASATTVQPPCTLLKAGTAPIPLDNSNSAVVALGPVVTTTVPSGSQLRVKAVVRAVGGGIHTTTSPIRLRWGYTQNHKSRLVFS